MVFTGNVFHRDRHWVTHVEVVYGVVHYNKPLIAVSPTQGNQRPRRHGAGPSEQEEGVSGGAGGGGDDGVEFDMQTKCHSLPGCVHLKECCEGVAQDFQPLARAILAALDVAAWIPSGRGSSGTNLARIMNTHGVVQRYVSKEQARMKLMAELRRQRRFGACLTTESPATQSPPTASTADGSPTRSPAWTDDGASKKTEKVVEMVEL